MNDNTAVFWQQHLELPPFSRGFHLIQNEVEQSLKTLPTMNIGLLNIFLQHTSASLCLSERACKSVQRDLERWFNCQIPDDVSRYEHSIEGEDDMPAHIKNVLLGASLTLPISKGQLSLGQWQGIMLCEHRNQAPGRRLILTVNGQK